MIFDLVTYGYISNQILLRTQQNTKFSYNPIKYFSLEDNWLLYSYSHTRSDSNFLPTTKLFTWIL